MRQLDTQAARDAVAEGLLTCRSHPADASLLIWNYTSKASYSRTWTPLMMMCRGLITRSDGKIVARPFPKFFNLEEHLAMGGAVPNEPFDVYEKLDGSLGILYPAPDGYPAIATRGSFESTQAIEATRMLRESNACYSSRFTYLFEILFPENRIVVNYGSRRELVLLAVIETATGDEIPLSEPPIRFGPKFPAIARRYDGITNINEARSAAEEGTEGVVIRFRESGLRLKVKLEEYVRLHRLLTGVTPRRVWEILNADQSLDEFSHDVPEEFAGWLRSVEAKLRREYEAIEDVCRADFTTLPMGDGVTRKDQAAVATRCTYPAILFRMLDGKDHSPLIWKAIYPPSANAFRCDPDEVTS